MSGDHIVFKVGLMWRNGGLHLETGVRSVDLQKGDRIIGTDQMLHVLGFRHDLETRSLL